MIHTYQLYLLNRHLFIDLPEGRALIDTGAPFSSLVTGRLTWQNQNHGVNQGGYMGFTFDKLSAEIGVQVEGGVHFRLANRIQVNEFAVVGNIVVIRACTAPAQLQLGVRVEDANMQVECISSERGRGDWLGIDIFGVGSCLNIPPDPAQRDRDGHEGETDG